MRISTAYFAGAGTVAVAIAAGLGGGLLFANIVSPHSPKDGAELSKLERRMATKPIPATSAPSEPVPYLAATQATATSPTVVAAPAQPQPGEVKSNATPAAQTNAANNAAVVQSAAAPQASNVADRAEPRESVVPVREAAVPRDAFAKARDADIKRASAEKRRAERQRWADKRRQRQPKEQELEAVEQKVREETEPVHAFAAEPVRLEMPRLRLFDSE